MQICLTKTLRLRRKNTFTPSQIRKHMQSAIVHSLCLISFTISLEIVRLYPQHEGFNSYRESGSFAWGQWFPLGYHWCWLLWLWNHYSGNLSILILIREISLLPTEFLYEVLRRSQSKFATVHKLRLLPFLRPWRPLTFWFLEIMVKLNALSTSYFANLLN